jgi:ABC-2 type transport system ATP-binding protein
MNAFEVSGLSKRYGRVQALRGVSFGVAAGEIFGYLGPNGAGKTTTLRIALGLVRADRGMARLLGAPAGDARAREAIGYLPGELRLYPDMTGWGLLDYLARFRRGRPPVLRARLLEALDLDEGTLSRRVKTLSHGTRQKLGLVLAMQHDPDLLLLDEPTAGLDPLVQRAFRGLLLERAARGKAVVLSSHVLSEVEAVCGRVAILRAGELLAVESIQTLRGRVVRQMHVRFEGEAPATLAGLPGVTNARIDGREALLSVQGDLNPLLREIATRPVEQLVFPEPQLEDIFLQYYGPEGGRRG